MPAYSWLYQAFWPMYQAWKLSNFGPSVSAQSLPEYYQVGPVDTTRIKIIVQLSFPQISDI